MKLKKCVQQHVQYYIIVLFFLFQKAGISQTYHWSNGMGGSGDDRSTQVITDSFGAVYVLGMFEDTVDFDTGPGVSNLYSTNVFGDLYVSKYDSIGNLIWVKQISSNTVLISRSIALDANNNIYITGEYTGTIDANPGPGIYSMTAPGNGYNVFFTKWDSFGNFIWARDFGASGSSCLVFIINVDFAGNIYLGGSFDTSFGLPVDFNPGPGIYTMTALNNANIPYVSKLDTAGNLIWAISYPAVAYSYGEVTSIGVDSLGNVYVAGDLGGTLDFDPGSGVFNMTSGGTADVFIAKLTPSGGFIWAKSFVGNGIVGLPTDLWVDSSNNIYTTGLFRGTVDFDPGTGTYLQTATGVSNSFFSKLDSSGNFVWVKILGGTSYIECLSSSFDKIGNIYLTGDYGGTADFDPGPAINNVSAATLFETFILKLDASGNFIWVKSIKGADSLSFNYGTSIVADAHGNVYVTGAYAGTNDLNPDFCSDSSSTMGFTDFFLTKLGPCSIPFKTTTDTSICSGQTAVFILPEFCSYTLSPGSFPTNTIIISPVVNTTYVLSVAFSNQCKITDSIRVTVNACTGFEKNEMNSDSFSVVPNPNNGDFIISGIREENVKLLNSTGQLIRQISIDEKNGSSVSLSGFDNGIYFISTKNGSKKVIVQR